MQPMTPTRQISNGPSLAWLDNWIARLPDLPDLPEDQDSPDLPEDQERPGKSYFRDLLAKQHLSGIHRLLSDAHVRGRLSRYSSPDMHEAIKTLLAESSWACAALTENNQLPMATSRTDTVRDIAATARTIRKLLNQLHELPPQLAPALSPEYLTQRHNDGNPPGFSARRHRAGRPATWRSSPTLNDLLTSLADDLDEEVALHQRAISSKRQKGGKWASLGGVVSILSHHTRQLTGTGTGTGAPDFELMADILSVLSPNDETPSADTLRKQFKAKAARKSGKPASSDT